MMLRAICASSPAVAACAAEAPSATTAAAPSTAIHRLIESVLSPTREACVRRATYRTSQTGDAAGVPRPVRGAHRPLADGARHLTILYEAVAKLFGTSRC